MTMFSSFIDANGDIMSMGEQKGLRYFETMSTLSILNRAQVIMSVGSNEMVSLELCCHQASKNCKLHSAIQNGP